MAEPTGAPIAVAGASPGGTALPGPVSRWRRRPAARRHTAIHSLHALVADREIHKYPNSTVAKMFFSQDPDGVGGRVQLNFVCSASSMGPDEAWTAGHCASNNAGLDQPGVQTTGSHTTSSSARSMTTRRCRASDAGRERHQLPDRVQGGRQRKPRHGRNRHAAIRGHGRSDDRGPYRLARLPGECRPETNTGWQWAIRRRSRLRAASSSWRPSSYGYDDDWPPDAVLSMAMGNNMTGGSSGGPGSSTTALPARSPVRRTGKTSSTGTTTGSTTPFPERDDVAVLRLSRDGDLQLHQGHQHRLPVADSVDPIIERGPGRGLSPSIARVL